jgi:hypothetical protein
LNKDDYSFDFNNNRLTINGGSLGYVTNRNYEILVSTFNNGIEYTQKVQITIENIDQLPLISIE